MLLRASAPELGRGDVLAGRYQIEAVIGTGGSGRVLRAFDRVARAAVALKILRPEYVSDPVWTERFARELRVGRQIQHPNVCRVFDIGDADGHRFLSMELATGGTVRGQLGPAALERPLEERIADARALVEGTAALHLAGIVHRDIKPENLLRMEDGRLVVSDFGLATDPGAGPATTIMVGTPRYMAPEVVMGEPATARADVWALGMVLHELLFGVRPDRSTVRRGVRRYTPPPLNSARERRLAELCGRCTNDELRGRPASALEVRREFDAALTGRRLRRGVDRRQALWGAIAIAALALLGVVRDRWSSRAVASLSQSAAAPEKRILQATGTPEEWGGNVAPLAAFTGRLHCFDPIDGGRKVRAVWGTPKVAQDIDVRTGARSPSPLLPETYADGCPRTSPSGTALLFEKVDSSGTHVFLSRAPDGRDAKELVRGAKPTWLPNGQEVVLAADSRHAAVFSIPTGEMTLVTDGDKGNRQLSDFAVDRTGKRLAVLYVTGPTENMVVVHALPTLNVLNTASVRAFSDRLRFASDGVLWLVTEGPQGLGEMAALSFVPVPALRKIGRVSDAQVSEFLQVDDFLVLANRQVTTDLWATTPSGPARLTRDGHSIRGVISVDGHVAIQRRLADGRLVISVRNSLGAEEQATEGPVDATPSFLPDGSGWVHAVLNRSQLSECSLRTGQCTVMHSDPLIPAFPVSDPSGRQVAYLALMNVPRVRLFSRADKAVKDLGPAGGDACAPIWTSETRLWVAQATSRTGMTWIEINTATGERTGGQLSASMASGHDCAVPEGLLSRRADNSPLVTAVSEETSHLRRITPARSM